MQQQYFPTSGPSLVSTENPHCPKCGERMSLARIARGRSAFVIETFECTRCRHIHIAIADRSDEFERSSLT